MFSTLLYRMLTVKFALYITFNLNKLKKAVKNNDSKTFNKLTRTSYKLYSDMTFKSSKADIEVFGIEKIDLNETYLIVSNHLSIVDISTIIEAFPKYLVFTAKKELSKVIVLTSWMRMCGCIFMDRDSVRESIKEINQGIENLKNGISMCIFPEGTRSTTGSIGEFKKGSFKLALKSGVKILPVVLIGTRSVYEDNGSKMRKGNIKVFFLDPIDHTKLGSDEIKNLNILVRDKINDVYTKFV